MGGETGMGRRRTGRGSTSTPRDVPSKFCAYSVHDHDDKVNTQIADTVKKLVLKDRQDKSKKAVSESILRQINWAPTVTEKAQVTYPFHLQKKMLTGKIVSATCRLHGPS